MLIGILWSAFMVWLMGTKTLAMLGAFNQRAWKDSPVPFFAALVWFGVVPPSFFCVGIALDPLFADSWVKLGRAIN